MTGNLLFATDYYRAGRELGQNMLPMQGHNLNFPLDNVNSTPPEASLTVDQMNSHAPNKETRELINNAVNRKDIVRYDDPIITDSQSIISNPKQYIDSNSNYPKTIEEITYETKVCKEPGEPYSSVCTRSLNNIKRKETLRKSVRVMVVYNYFEENVKRGIFYGISTGDILGREYHQVHYPKERCMGIGLSSTEGIAFERSIEPKATLVSYSGWTCPYTGEYINKKPTFSAQIDYTGDFRVFPSLSAERNCGCRGRSNIFCNIPFPTIEATFDITYVNIDNPNNDTWSSNCQELDRLSDQGFCAIIDRKCLSGPETRNIDGVPTYRSCWQEQLTYLCEYPTTCTNNCESLRAQGCEQINSKCSQSIAGKCVEWTNTFRCPSGKRTLKVVGSGSSTFCLDGSCHEVSYEANNEMAESISQLQVLQETQNAQNKSNPLDIKLFTGKSLGCSKSFTNYKDCCGTHRGWGINLHMSNCNGEEQQLAQQRQEGLCHLVGTYVAEKFLGQWLRKKTTFCCFPSKLMRIIHEQGRPQISLSWGSAEHPDCRGFSIQELCQLNFDRIDLSEFVSEIQKRYKAPDTTAISNNLNNQMQVMISSLGASSNNYNQDSKLRQKQEQLYKEMR